MINLDTYYISAPHYSNYAYWNGSYLIYNISLFRLHVYTSQLYCRQLAFRATLTTGVIGIMSLP
jgi:hypothetical protein